MTTKWHSQKALMMTQIKTGLQWRAAEVTEIKQDDDAVRVDLSFSSEAPVERFYGEWGDEVLSHDAEHIRMDWLEGGTAPLLEDHDMTKQIGVVEGARIDEQTRRGIATVRFSRREEVKGIIQDVIDGIRGNVSVGYRVNKVIQEVAESGRNIFRVTDWQPMEVSLVSVPADMSVGVGRSDEFETEVIIPEILTVKKEDIAMTEEVKKDAPKIDVNLERENIRKEEMKRANDIRGLAKAHGLNDLAEKAVSEGTSVNAFRGELLAALEKRDSVPAIDARQDANADKIEQDQVQHYSLFRALEAVKSGDWSQAGFEREMSQEIEGKLGKRAKGMYVPTNVLNQKRDITVGGNGELVGTDHMANDYIEALRPMSAVMQAGARTMSGLVGNVSIPAANALTNTYWVAENGAPTEGAPTFRQVTMSPKTVGAYVDISRSLQLQGTPDAEMLIRDDIVKSIATAIDKVAINGGGSNEPTGILQTSGIGDVAIGTNGGAATWASIIDLMGDVDSANAWEGALAFLGSAKVRSHLMQKVRVASTDSRFIMESRDELVGYNYWGTNNSPDNLTKGTLSGAASALIFGNFSDLIIGQWGALDLTVDPYSNSTTGAVRVVGFQDVDVAVRHAASFSAIQDIDTTA